MAELFAFLTFESFVIIAGMFTIKSGLVASARVNLWHTLERATRDKIGKTLYTPGMVGLRLDPDKYRWYQFTANLSVLLSSVSVTYALAGVWATIVSHPFQIRPIDQVGTVMVLVVVLLYVIVESLKAVCHCDILALQQNCSLTCSREENQK